jgi:hypothetical protein
MGRGTAADPISTWCNRMGRAGFRDSGQHLRRLVLVPRRRHAPLLGSKSRLRGSSVRDNASGVCAPSQGVAALPGCRPGEIIRPSISQRHRRLVRRVWAERRPCHQLFTLRTGCHATLVGCGASMRSWAATGLVTPAACAGGAAMPTRMATVSTPSPKPIWRIEVS